MNWIHTVFVDGFSYSTQFVGFIEIQSKIPIDSLFILFVSIKKKQESETIKKCRIVDVQQIAFSVLTLILAIDFAQIHSMVFLQIVNLSRHQIRQINYKFQLNWLDNKLFGID